MTCRAETPKEILNKLNVSGNRKVIGNQRDPGWMVLEKQTTKAVN